MRTPSFIIILTVAILLAGFIGLIAYYSFNPTPPQSSQAEPSGVGGEGSRTNTGLPARPVVSAQDPVRGDPSAPIAIVEFGDFLCPACADMEPVLASVLEKYKGRVKLVWKDLPNTARHPLAERAAIAARCAGEQDRFWPYHDILFEHQTEAFEERFTQFARDLNLDMGTFTQCLQNERTKEAVTRIVNEAILLRVDATPYFFVGTQRFSGAVSDSQLKEAVERTPNL